MVCLDSPTSFSFISKGYSIDSVKFKYFSIATVELSIVFDVS